MCVQHKALSMSDTCFYSNKLSRSQESCETRLLMAQWLMEDSVVDNEEGDNGWDV